MMSALEKKVLDKTINQEKGTRKGSDPLTSTARGKLQNQRQKLNDKINKELRMRTGAENLFRRWLRAYYYKRKAEKSMSRQTRNSATPSTLAAQTPRKRVRDMDPEEYKAHRAMMRRKQRAALSSQKKTAIRRYVLVNDIPRCEVEDVSAIPGTRKMHQFVRKADYIIAARNLACFCTACREGRPNRCANAETVGSYDTFKLKESAETVLNTAFMEPTEPETQPGTSTGAAENNRKLKERVELELSYFNSNIQLLKEQLSEMNSSVEVYQHENCTNFTPMIPLGLKETTPIDFANAFKDAILEHYSEDPEKYSKELKELMEFREAVRTPQRSAAGVDLLTEYFNQLSFVEKRFFASRTHLSIFFHWYDSLTGFPDTQKSISFEKGSILYNIGALYTQIACKQDRSQKQGVMQAIIHFEKAAGVFSYLNNRFSSAPSQDMKAETLVMLVSLMLAQAQECVLEGRLIVGPKEGILACTQIAQEAAAVSKKYKNTHEKMASEPTRSYIPFSWLSMAETKYHFYRGLSHYYVAMALIEQKDSKDKDKVRKMFSAIHTNEDDQKEDNGLPNTEKERQILGKAYLREAVVNHEESLRIHNLCKQLRKIDTFRDILQKTHERSLGMFSALEEEDDFSDVPLVPAIKPGTGHDSLPIQTEFSKVKVIDIFWKMGPIAVFNAASDWTAPRKVVLERQPTEGFGFSVRGDSPVVIADLEKDSVAARSGMKVKDYIVAVGSVDTKCSTHDEVVQLVREASLSLTVYLITPLPKPDKQAARPFASLNLPASPVKSQQQNAGASSERERKSASRISAPWMFKRRNSAKENGGSKSPQPTGSPYSSSPYGNGTMKVVTNGRIKSVENVGDVEL